MTIAQYCREIEAYLCRKNDGHLIRVVGPSFEMVSRWASDGVPLKVAFSGIDRYFERFYRKGPRRRPVRIDFCEADVLDVFDEWRRALGISATSASSGPAETVDEPVRRKPSLAAHLERALLRLTNGRATGSLGPDADAIIDRVAQELAAVRASKRAVRGEERQAVVDRLAALDGELLVLAKRSLSDAERESMEREAAEALAPFRPRMTDAVYERAFAAAVDRLVHDRFGLPTIAPPS